MGPDAPDDANPALAALRELRAAFVRLMRNVGPDGTGHVCPIEGREVVRLYQRVEHLLRKAPVPPDRINPSSN